MPAGSVGAVPIPVLHPSAMRPSRFHVFPDGQVEHFGIQLVYDFHDPFVILRRHQCLASAGQVDGVTDVTLFV